MLVIQIMMQEHDVLVIQIMMQEHDGAVSIDAEAEVIACFDVFLP
jgi:hypothetical protein